MKIIKKNLHIPIIIPIFVMLTKRDKVMNVFQYSNAVNANWKANLREMTDYEPKYTFYADFAIAEFCEVYMKDRNAVRSTYNNVIKSWGKDIKAMAEIVMVLNHKVWAFYDKVDSKIMGVGDTTADYFAHLYNELWEKADLFVQKQFEDDEDALSYYYRVID